MMVGWEGQRAGQRSMGQRGESGREWGGVP